MPRHRHAPGSSNGQPPSSLEAERTSSRSAPYERVPCDWPGCPKTFGRQPDLDRHRNSVHQTKTKFWCTVPGCNRSEACLGQRPFPRKDKLDSHVKTVHRAVVFPGESSVHPSIEAPAAGELDWLDGLNSFTGIGGSTDADGFASVGGHTSISGFNNTLGFSSADGFSNMGEWNTSDVFPFNCGFNDAGRLIDTCEPTTMNEFNNLGALPSANKFADANNFNDTNGITDIKDSININGYFANANGLTCAGDFTNANGFINTNELTNVSGFASIDEPPIATPFVGGDLTNMDEVGQIDGPGYVEGLTDMDDLLDFGHL